MNRKPLISVYIATKDRTEQLRSCITAIIHGTYKQYEILIADQSEDIHTKTMLRSFHESRIRYFRNFEIGKSNALNSLRNKARGNIHVFTDDDCIASRTWLSTLTRIYDLHPEIDGVLGRVEPFSPKRHMHEICPSLFQIKTRSVITDRRAIHYKSVGMGNNMSFRNRVIRQAGPFFPWLGPGAQYGFAGGDESEYIYRVLRLHKRLLYDPSVLIYHDRWVTFTKEESLQSLYSRGLYAFWFYYVCYAMDISLLLNIGTRVWERIIPRFITMLRHVYRGKINSATQDILYIWNDTVSFVIGITVGTAHAIRTRMNL